MTRWARDLCQMLASPGYSQGAQARESRPRVASDKCRGDAGIAVLFRTRVLFCAEIQNGSKCLGFCLFLELIEQGLPDGHLLNAIG
jgi:hypothetical protein